MSLQRASGCLFGMAFGDALGADTEFMTVAQILAKYPPDGPHELRGNPARVTDDTQMTLAVGRALSQVKPPYTRENTFASLRDAFIAWYHDPENNRAPGMTCMRACKSLAEFEPWYTASQIGSKGCGANMRVQPVGLLRDIDAPARAALAQFQAAITHGHPTALAASDLTAFAIADLVTGGDPAGLVGRLIAYARSQRTVWHGDWLDPLLTVVPQQSGAEYISRGWDECLNVLQKLQQALESPDRAADPCLATGAGWVAEEALATGLLCFLLFPDDPLAAIRRAAVSSGDSDSIGCLAGAFAGAYHGLAAWPAAWIERIEYRDELEQLGKLWDHTSEN